MSDDKIKKIPTRFKRPPSADGPQLVIVDRWSLDECNHRTYHEDCQIKYVQYRFREGETEVECGRCETKLDPMFVLRVLAGEESQWNRTREAYNDEMARLEKRGRTKCENCGQMTRISRK